MMAATDPGANGGAGSRERGVSVQGLPVLFTISALLLVGAYLL